MNDHGIRIWNIQSRLDDRRRDQHINLMIDKPVHDVLQLSFMHLSMRILNNCIRYKGCNLRCDHLYIIYPVIYIIYLTIPRQLTLDRFFDKFGIKLHDIGLDRPSVNRRFFQNTHIPNTDQAHMKCTRNRSRCQGQDINICLHLLDLFLMCYTKPLLLVYDQQTKLLKCHILR